MSCELYKLEMHALRPGDDLPDSKPLLDHLATCPECAQWFANFSACDERIRQPFLEVPERPSLEAKIFASLAYERLQNAPRKSRWKNWFLLPIAASLLVGVTLGLGPWLQEVRLSRQVATLLSQPPSAQMGQTLAVLEVPALDAEVTGAQAGITQTQQNIERLQNEVAREDANYAATQANCVRLKKASDQRPGLVAGQEVDDALARGRLAAAQVDAAKFAVAAAHG
jgi:hypothetical protein